MEEGGGGGQVPGRENFGEGFQNGKGILRTEGKGVDGERRAKRRMCEFVLSQLSIASPRLNRSPRIGWAHPPDHFDDSFLDVRLAGSARTMAIAMTIDRVNSRSFPLLALLLLTAQNVCLASPRKWIELRSPHFVVVTNASEHQARQVAEQFETIRSVFQEYFRTASINDRPLIIIAASDQSTFRPLLPEAWTQKGAARRSGIYLNGPDKSYIGLQVDQPYEKIYHEYVHYLMRRMNPRLPTWMVEGLAEFYANVRIESKKVLVGTPSASNLTILSQRTLLPLTTLFEVNASSPYYNEESKISIFYAESWALTHYLMARDWDENSNRLSDFIGLLGPNVSQVDAARKTIGDPAVLEPALNEYVHKFAFTAVRLERAQMEQGDYRVRPLSDAESLAVRADFMTHEGQYVKAQHTLEEALKLDPKLADAYENMAFLYFRQDKKADAEKWSEQAVALNPQGYLANYFYGASLLRESLPNDSTVAAAEASLRTAVRSNPEFAPAYDALAFCLARPGSHQNLDEAHRMALAAVERDPSDLGHRVRVVEVLLAMGRQDDAINEATRAVSMAKTPADQSAAAGALEAAQKFRVSEKKMKEQREEQPSSAPSNQAFSPIEVLTDTMGVDFNPYLDPLLKTVRQHWYELIPISAGTKRGKVVLEFAVLKDGSVAGLKVVGSSGDIALDRPAYGSITGSNPFPPLPPEFNGPYLRLRFSFYYNLSPSPRNSFMAPLVED